MLIIEMMARWRIRLSYGEKKDVCEASLGNGIIQGDCFSPLLFALMIDPIIMIVKTRLGEHVEVLNSMDDPKASMVNVQIAQTVHNIEENSETG